MRKSKYLSVGLGVLSCLAALAGGTNLPPAPGTSLVVTAHPQPGPVQIVTYRDEVDVDGMIRELGVAPIQVYKGGLNGFAAPMTPAMADQLKHDPRVLFVEPDGPVALCDQTIPTGLVRMGITNFPVAHINGNPYGTNAPLNVDVAVLDSGIDPTQPDLPEAYVVSSSTGGDGSDTLGHGTLVAGVIAARDNGFGVVGVAPGVRLWNIQCIGAPPYDSWSYVLQGMNTVYAYSSQIAVANMSIVNAGSSAPIVALHIITSRLVNSGTVLVAAAGNNGMDLAGPDGIYGTADDYVPAAFPEAMAVSAMDPTNDTIASFSNFSSIPRPNNAYSGGTNYVVSPGGAIDVAAPGVWIETTGTNGTYGWASGTSLAAPHVTGLVALYIAANGRATNAAGVYAIRQAIINNSLPQSQWSPNGSPFDPVTNPTGDPDSNPEPLAMPSENWVPMPYITNYTNTPTGLQVGFQAVPGYNYTPQYTESLPALGQWSNLPTIVGTGSVVTVTATDPGPGSDSRFYRLLRQPTP